MIRLNLTKEKQKLDLGYGVSVTCEPLTSAIFAAARNDATIPKLDEDRQNTELVTNELVKAIARRTIVEWDGIGDADGNVIDPDAVGINAMLDVWQLYDSFNTQFMGPFLLLREEGNASAPSPTGTSAVVLDTATPVSNDATTVPAC